MCEFNQDLDDLQPSQTIGTLWRGSCTDQSWNSTACPHYCDARLEIGRVAFQTVIPFSAAASSSTSPSSINTANSSTSSSSSAATTATLSAPEPAKSSNDNKGLKAGLGLSIGIIVSLIIAFGFYQFYQRRRTEEKEKEAKEKAQLAAVESQDMGTIPSPPLAEVNGSMQWEMPTNRNIHEAPANAYIPRVASVQTWI
ncbi:MAG: hypothetical protein Q9222_006947 [Ikaeria aurantiellina]